MKKYIIPLSLALVLGFVSCQDRLEIPQKGVISTSDFYASDADAQAALADMYANYVENVAGTEGIDNPEQVILNYSADDVYAAGSGWTDHDAFRVFDEFSYDGANGTLKSCYTRYYGSIYHANLIISNFTDENRLGEKPKYESAVTHSAVAQARVMRAFLHLQAAIIWNQPIVMDRIYEGDEMPPVNDKSQEEILQWVIDECQKAISSGNLPKRNGTSDKDATAIMTVGFAQFVAGKAAVFKNDMATARKYLGDLINSGDYALVKSEDFWTNFHVTGDGNCEKIFEPNFIDNPSVCASRWSSWVMRDRWMVANVFNWRTKSLLGVPMQSNSDGWGGGAISETFAEKFYKHDGDSPRRKATFLTEDEFLYEMEWKNSTVNDGSLAAKKADANRGLNTGGLFGRGKYFEWKMMSYMDAPKILTGGEAVRGDNVKSGLGDNSNEKNFLVARYAEALLLYAEACIGSSDEAKGLAALKAVQERSGSGKISSKLTFDDVMEEKQYELWFENCRFPDLVRWSKAGKVDLNAVYNTSGLHKNVPTVHDEYSEDGMPGYGKEHKLYVTYEGCPSGAEFKVGKHEYLPFPRDVMTTNTNLHNVLGWATE